MTTICDEVEVWENRYKPITNPLQPDEETTLFETYGADYDFVTSYDHTKIWTWVDGDNGTYIVAGWHLVNRIGYYLTEEPWADENMVIPYEKYEEEVSFDGSKLLNELNTVVRNRFGDNAVEALIGVLSTLVNDDQLKVLIKNLKS
jgi:hypothetical protein